MEGPGVKLIAEKLKFVIGEKVVEVGGNTKQPKEQIIGKELLNVKSHGKNLFLIFDDFVVKVHFMMFGSFSLEEREKPVRLKLKLGNVYFYNASIKFISYNDVKLYDSELDVLSKKWNRKKVMGLMKNDKRPVTDVLLYQAIFAGVGNIIKNEVIGYAKVHPLSKTNNIPLALQRKILDEARDFSEVFFQVRKEGKWLREKMKFYRKYKCNYCSQKITVKKIGKTNRMTFWCEKCFVKY